MTPNDRISEIRAGFTKILDGLTEVRQGVHGLEGDLLDWAESSVDVGTYQLTTIDEADSAPAAAREPEETPQSPWAEHAAEETPAEQPVADEPAPAAPQESESADTAEETPADPAPETEQPNPGPEPAAPAVTLEQVRAKLADLSRAGHTDDVRQIIQDTGAAKLSEVPEEKFADLMAAAEKITA